VPDPDPFDPIAEAHRQWSIRWPAHADHMAAVTTVMRVQQLLLARIEAILQPYGLTFAAYEALRLLAFTRSGSMPMGKMGVRLMVHPASVTNAIRRLEQRGLVERHISEQDRRIVLATITDQGRAVARDATTALNRADFGIAALSADETAQLTSMLRHVRVAVGDIADVPVGSSLLIETGRTGRTPCLGARSQIAPLAAVSLDELGGAGPAGSARCPWPGSGRSEAVAGVRIVVAAAD
jgi:DNA-binding MarR family transcriptional regulator